MHPDPLTTARRGLTSLQTAAAMLAAGNLSPREEREVREEMPQLADVARTAALVSIAESLHALAAGEPAGGEESS
ncbi:hypothetical protein AB0873_14910 [Micromonospora sp. NPDC047707]|uniref:hypothetical protein n=1 Tax=Micromonospora sp. NPDC047707 TaxID=3154498 RepID=UPI00345157FB